VGGRRPANRRSRAACSTRRARPTWRGSRATGATRTPASTPSR
jgi:hypothetical protein